MAKKEVADIVKVEFVANVTHGTSEGRIDYKEGQVIDIDTQLAEELVKAKVIKILG